MEITKDKVTELFCIIDEFYKVFDAENAGKLFLSEDGVKRRRRKASLSSNPQPIGFRGNLLVKRQKFFYCTYFLGITETS